MNPIITFNDISINIKIIDDKKSHYQLNIPNNEANKKLIENTVFKFEKSGTQTIIMHDDVHVFQLSKMECSYSDYIKMQNKLENTEKELLLLKNKIDNTECIMTVLQQQILKKLINNEHLMQQQMKFYYDKETEQMKVCEDLPYIIVRNVNNIIEEKILHEKSQLIWFKEFEYYKIRNYLISNENIKNKHIKYYRAFFDDNPDYDIQHIIPAKKMLKIWKRKVINIPLNPILEVTFFPVDIYTNETHIINCGDYVDIFAIWYGDIEYKDDVPDDYNFKYIYDNISKF